jgi:hypothetical protein
VLHHRPNNCLETADRRGAVGARERRAFSLQRKRRSMVTIDNVQ